MRASEWQWVGESGRYTDRDADINALMQMWRCRQFESVSESEKTGPVAVMRESGRHDDCQRCRCKCTDVEVEAIAFGAYSGMGALPPFPKRMSRSMMLTMPYGTRVSVAAPHRQTVKAVQSTL